MTDIRYDVIGIGNAIVDILARCENSFLSQHGLDKGTMRLVDAGKIAALYDTLGGAGSAREISGGSCANTLAGIASFGGQGAFIGKVAADAFGQIFSHDIRAAGVAFANRPVYGAQPTSRSLVLVTPDGERTMSTFLGISTDLAGGEVDPDLIRASKILYLEGYLFDRPEAKAAFHQAVTIARSAERKVALTLSDPFCVERHRAEFLSLIRSGVDILFANEREIAALYETADFDDAARRASADVPQAVLTRSEKGSVLLAGERRIEVPAEPIAKVVDATGAGDLYAAGVLFGLSTDRDLAVCGRLGSLAAAEVISHLGARPERRLAELVGPL